LEGKRHNEAAKSVLTLNDGRINCSIQFTDMDIIEVRTKEEIDGI